MTTAIAPPEGQTKAEVLQDLERRISVAEAAAAKAEAAGDWEKLRAAMERYHLRVMQHGWVEQRPDGARCWKCGELGGDLFALSVDCLAHRTPLLIERAAVLAARDAGGA